MLMQKNEISRPNRILKRSFDFIASFVGLFIFSPIILLSWLIASLETRSNGLFFQIRVGMHGRLFTIYKIKTMKNASTKNDDSDLLRITRSGHFFRKFKIDEIPQLWNVLRGDMSLVGPRPDIPGYADKLEGEDRIILSIRPGITGPASIKWRNEEFILANHTSAREYNDYVIWPDKIQINKDYVQNYSFTKDLKYIFLTIRR